MLDARPYLIALSLTSCGAAHSTERDDDGNANKLQSGASSSMSGGLEQRQALRGEQAAIARAPSVGAPLLVASGATLSGVTHEMSAAQYYQFNVPAGMRVTLKFVARTNAKRFATARVTIVGPDGAELAYRPLEIFDPSQPVEVPIRFIAQRTGLHTLRVAPGLESVQYKTTIPE